MKRKILIKYHNQYCRLEQYGDWIDLKVDNDYHFRYGETKIIGLGISMKLPEGLQANVVPRSSLGLKYGLLQLNHYGVIDNKYSGNNDIWGFPAYAIRDTSVMTGDRICQFEIRPKMNATFWQKLKWMLTTKYDFVVVDDLNSEDRGGFGHSGR